MIRAGEIRKGNGQIQFSLAVLGAPQLQPKVKLSNANPAPSFTRNESNLSDSRVLVEWLSTLCTLGLLLWAIIQLWLVEYYGEQTGLVVCVNRSNRGPNLASAL
jgi:hypothetical protein